MTEFAQELLRIASITLRACVTQSPVAATAAIGQIRPDSPRLLEPAGAFVSLHHDDQLRGCIGTIHPVHPLFRAVAENTIAAATRDYRFSPLLEHELPKVVMEISVLSPMTPVASPDEIVIGSHGLLAETSRHRGLLLPQVAPAHAWDAYEFWRQTLRKASLDPHHLPADFQMHAFTAEIFSGPAVPAP